MTELSVLVACHNNPTTLVDTLNSLTCQAVAGKHEIIVVDDASDSKTQSVLSAYEDTFPHLKVIRHERNKGLLQTRLTGFENANGKYIRFFDDDDLCPPGSLSRSVDLMREFNSEAIRFNHNCLKGDDITDGWLYRDVKAFVNDMRGYEAHLCVGGVVLNILSAELMGRISDKVKHININQLEDDLINSMLGRHTRCISFTPEIHYTVRVREASMSTKNWSSDDFEDAAKAIRLISENASPEYLYGYLKHKLNGLFDSQLSRIHEIKPFVDSTALDNFFDAVSGAIDKANLQPSAIKTKYAPELFSNDRVRARINLFLKSREDEDLPESTDIKQADVVSFDIFDTLLERPLLDAADLYKVLNIGAARILGFPQFDFSRLRVDCENRVRTVTRNQSNMEIQDVSIYDIYKEIGRDLQVSSEKVSALVDLEIGMELRFCKQRRIGKRLFDEALAQGKFIVLVSDMYLAHEHVERLLLNAGYSGWKALFVSSSSGKLKATGGLYQLVDNWLAHETGMRNVLHIGDNIKSDVASARANGWAAKFIPKSSELLSAYNHQYSQLLAEMKDVSLGVRIAYGLLANKLYSDPAGNIEFDSLFNGSDENFGYCAIGPFLFSLVLFLLDNECDVTAFVARDGYLPKRAFDCICEKLGIERETTYIKASRRSYLPIFIKDGTEIHDLQNRWIKDNYKVSDFLKYHVRLDDVESYRELLAEYDIQLSDYTNSSFGKIKKFLRDCPDILENVQKAKGAAIEYFIQCVPDSAKSIAVFDSGNQGSIQKALELALPQKNFVGYYINTNNGVSDTYMLDSRAYNCYFNNYTSSSCPVSREVLELFLSEPVGSCIGYSRLEDGCVAPVLDEFEHTSATEEKIRTIQAGAMQFIEDMASVIDAEALHKMSFEKVHMFAVLRLVSEGRSDGDRDILSDLELTDVLSPVRSVKIQVQNPKGQGLYQIGGAASDKREMIILAEKLLKEGKVEPAVMELMKVIAIDPDNVRGRRLLAEALLRAGRRVEAIDNLKMVRKTIPGNRNLRRRYFKMRYPKLAFWIEDKPFE